MASKIFIPRDSDIRQALRRRLTALHPDALVLDELAMKHGDFRVDLAVIADRLHGFEIKSDADTLKRLPDQAKQFSLVFHRMTLVVGPAHLAEALAIVPKWWGVMIAVRDGMGGADLSLIRESAENPKPNYRWVVRLLWRDELAALLRARGEAKGLKQLKYWQVANRCLEVFTPEELTEAVTRQLRVRKGSPAEAPEASYDYEDTDHSTWD